MDLVQLRTLTAVAKTLNFTRASEDLNLSQPAVSHQIKALEKEIGQKLFVRGLGGVSLTIAGKAAFEHAQKILDIADGMKLDLSDRAKTIYGRLAVGGSFEGLDNPFFSLYLGFKELYPEVEIAYQGEKRPEEVVDKVIKGDLDLGLVADEYLRANLASIPYGEYKLGPVVGSGHRLAKKTNILPEDLAREDWVLFDSASRFRRYVDECFKEYGFKPQSIFETNDGALIKAMVSAGKHVSCLPAWGIQGDNKNEGIVPIKIEGWGRTIQVSLIWNPSRVSARLRALITFLLEADLDGVSLFRLKLD